MPDLTLLQDILILICLALANAYLFSRLRQSPIVGYLVTGLVVGPYGFHLIGAAHEVEIVAEIGVILLLFTIGLEFSYSRIMLLKKLLLRRSHPGHDHRAAGLPRRLANRHPNGQCRQPRHGDGPLVNSDCFKNAPRTWRSGLSSWPYFP